jgi:hypothetical protein
MAIENPKFQIIKKENAFQLRCYAPYITAQVEVEGKNYQDAANLGFSPLAGFIFGENTTAQKINMTAPVMAKPSSQKNAVTAPVTVTGKGNYHVAFVMPKQYSLNNLPKPRDSRVKFVENPEKRMAVIRYSGSFNQRNFEKNLIKLNEWMQKEKLESKGEPIIAGYDPPFTPWFLKHNEIWIQVK